MEKCTTLLQAQAPKTIKRAHSQVMGKCTSLLRAQARNTCCSGVHPWCHGDSTDGVDCPSSPWHGDEETRCRMERHAQCAIRSSAGLNPPCQGQLDRQPRSASVQLTPLWRGVAWSGHEDVGDGAWCSGRRRARHRRGGSLNPGARDRSAACSPEYGAYKRMPWCADTTS